MASSPHPKLTEEQYLEFERAADFRNEFLDGDVIDMSGASLEHANLQGNLYFELRSAVRMGCQAFNAGLRVRVSRKMHAYPDVLVVCGKPLLADEHQDNILNPTAIFEVLSPSTEKYDRGLKFKYYGSIKSLRDYVLIDQEETRVEQFTRQSDGTWTYRVYEGPAEELRVDSIGAAIQLSRIYARINV